jgi:hypothetical protein
MADDCLYDVIHVHILVLVERYMYVYISRFTAANIARRKTLTLIRWLGVLCVAPVAASKA